MTAQGTEARRGETAGLDAKRDGPVGTADAPNPLYQEGYSMTDRTDRGPMGAFEGYGDFDRTEQQAVTVAQEFSPTLSARLRVSARHAIEGNWPRQTAGRLYEAADAFDRLASVSSASAEIPATMKPWTGGDGAPDDWDGGSVMWETDGRRSFEEPAHSRHQWKHGSKPGEPNIVAYTPARVLNLPEPVPATNQAGEVERIAKALALHRHPGGSDAHNPPTRWPSSPHDTLSARDGTVPLTWDFAEQCRAEARIMLAALATQPATSQEGEGLQAAFAAVEQHFTDFEDSDYNPEVEEVQSRAREGLALIRRHMAGVRSAAEAVCHSAIDDCTDGRKVFVDPEAFDRLNAVLGDGDYLADLATLQEGEAVAWCSPGQFANLTDVDRDGGVYLPIRKTKRGNFTMPLFAATPTPPTLSEDLREALESSLAKRSVAIMDAPYTAAFNAALDMVARDTALARAQVKAS